MKSLYALPYVFIVLWNCTFFAAVHDGNLYIQNDNQVYQFECMYTANGQPMGPIIVYNKEINLGPITAITDIQIKRYGKWLGVGASYYSFPEQLRLCKSQSEHNWVLHITNAVNGWDIEAKIREQPTRSVDIKQPLDYFEKARKNEDDLKPRYLLDLPEKYTQKQVAERLAILTEQIKQDPTLPDKLKPQAIELLHVAADYAIKFLAYPNESGPQFDKLNLEWRGKIHPERVEHGKKITCALLDKMVLTTKQQDHYLQDIVDFIWFLYDRALAKGQVFEEGTFIIQDTQHFFYKFLMKYVKMVSPEIKDTLDDPARDVSPGLLAYSRQSSHFMLEQEKFRHYGIDIQFEDDRQGKILLPAQKKHILFGRISDDLIFIKPERAGLNFGEITAHAMDLVGAQLRKPWLKYYFKTYLPKTVNATLCYYIGTDDAPNFRKERIPEELLEKCLTILQSEKLTNEQIRDLMYIFSTQGIHGIHNEIDFDASYMSTTQKGSLRAYLEQLRKEGFDHQEIRYGREVIFTYEELAQQCH